MWDNMPGMLTLFLCRYFKKTSALRLANVQACKRAERRQISLKGSTEIYVSEWDNAENLLRSQTSKRVDDYVLCISNALSHLEEGLLLL